MSKKIRRKKNDNLTRDRRLANIFTSNIGITLLPGDKSEIVNMTTLNTCTKTSNQQLFDITGHQHKWGALLCVFGRTITGDEYFKTEYVESERMCYSKEISDSMSGKHTEMYNAFNPGDFCCIGWIACPHKREFDLDDMAKLFTKLGAWDYQSKRELNKQA